MTHAPRPNIRRLERSQRELTPRAYALSVERNPCKRRSRAFAGLSLPPSDRSAVPSLNTAHFQPPQMVGSGALLVADSCDDECWLGKPNQVLSCRKHRPRGEPGQPKSWLWSSFSRTVGAPFSMTWPSRFCPSTRALLWLTRPALIRD